MEYSIEMNKRLKEKILVLVIQINTHGTLNMGVMNLKPLIKSEV